MPVLTSDNVWELRKLPARLVVLGGGPIGCELAQAFARFGSKVTQVEMLPRILAREDPEVSEMVAARFRAEGIDVRVGHRAVRVEKDALVCESANETVSIPFDSLLCALGRVPNTSGYGLEELGIPLTKARTVETNEYLQTLYPNIYACGDVAGPYQFTHTASHQAWFAAVNALFGSFRKFRADYSVIPWATFTDPEVARVGLNESEAAERGIAYEVSRYGIDELDRAIADDAAYGMVKVLTVPGRDRILGATIVGEHAGDLIVEFISRDEARHRPEQDPRHDPHLPDAGRGQQIRRRGLEESARAPGRAEEAGALPRVDARLILPLLLWASSAAAAFDHAHPTWDALLKKHVVLLDGGKASQLRYADMARERTALKAYLQSTVGGERARVRGLEPRRADRVPDQRLQRVHGGEGADALPGHRLDLGFRQGVRQPVPRPLLPCCSGSREASTTSSTASCARPIASRASISQ